ncbi:MAG: protein kinase [Gammaproteobacteria bacterium]|nr:protein kinase [Gammaproteobacteria bacterium]
MFNYLRPLLTPQICDAFNINDVDTFFDCASRARTFIAANPHEQKITKGEEFTSKRQGNLVSICSFINTKSPGNPEGGVYAMSVKPMGKGQYSGAVNWGLRIDREDGTLYTIKVMYPDPNDHERLIYLKNEISVGLTQGFFAHKELMRPKAGRIERDKYYLVSPYAGITLTEWLKTNPSETNRIEVAIQLCLQIEAMHAKKCVHRDLKLNNIFIDPTTLKVTIGDYGFAKPDVANSSDLLGSRIYLPIPTSIRGVTPELHDYLRNYMFHMGPINLDTFALKRVLNMPIFPNLNARAQPPSLLQGDVLDALADLIDTRDIEPPDSTNHRGTPLEIATRLILFLYQQPVPTLFSPDIQQAIATIYLNKKITSVDEKKAAIVRYLDAGLGCSGDLPPAATDLSSNDLTGSAGSPTQSINPSPFLSPSPF